MPMQGTFNANQYEPNQGYGIHPPAQKIPFTIASTLIKENSAKDGGYLVVEFTTPLGVVNNIYNLWSKSPKAVEIAYGQLSALCRAINIYNLDWQNDGAALRGGRGVMDIGYQKDEEPNPEFPNRKGYTEVKRVYDAAGNEPGKAPAQAQPQVQNQPQTNQQQPMQQQPGGGWGNQAPQGQPSQQPPNGNGGWQGGQPQQQAAPQQIPSAPNGQAWQPGNAGPNAAPPWGNR